jgi:hypothetical protein
MNDAAGKSKMLLFQLKKTTEYSLRTIYFTACQLSMMQYQLLLFFEKCRKVIHPITPIIFL